MFRRIYLIINLVLFAAGTIAWNVPLLYDADPSRYSALVVHVANLMAMLYLLCKGTLITTRWKWLLFLLMALAVAGSVTAFLHEPRLILFNIAMISVPVLYSLWYFSKPAHDTNDILKLIWVVLYFCFNWYEFAHFSPLHPLVHICLNGFLYIVYLQFYRLESIRLQEAAHQWDFEPEVPENNS